MDKSSESSSDSDSSSSTSWVFVDDNTTPNEKSANMFHLDCSREPIQELTEQDLVSTGSDLESDTDGISVISESEIPNDNLCANVEVLTCSNDGQNKPNVACNDEEGKASSSVLVAAGKENERLPKMLKLQHMLGIGFVLTAVFLASCSRFMTKDSVKSADDSNTVPDVSYDEIYVATRDDVSNIHGVKNNFDQELEQIVDITMSCSDRYKPRSDIKDKEIKKCVKKRYRIKRTGSKMNRETYNAVSCNVDSSSNEQDVDSTIYNKNDKNTKRKHNKYKKENRYCNKNTGDTICSKQNDDQPKYQLKQKSKVDKFEKNSRNKDQFDYTKNKFQFEGKKGIKRKYMQPQSGENNNYILLKKPSKLAAEKKHSAREYKHFGTKEYHFKSKQHKNKHQQSSKVIIVAGNDKNYKYKENIVNKSEKFDENNYGSKYRSNINSRKQVNATSGEWYTNLHKGRNQIRKQEHLSDWVFDRAYIRSKKRNKAQWYFKWMNIREQLRYKQNYRPYSS